MPAGHKSAAELRDETDDDVRAYLSATFGQQEWSKSDAIDGFLTYKGIGASSYQFDRMVQVVAVSIGRICHEVVNGFNRYWWTGKDRYQDPAAIPQEILFARSTGYKASAAGLISLAGQHDLLRSGKGIVVDTAEIDDMIAELTALKAAL